MATAIEYGLIAALIAVGAIAAMNALPGGQHPANVHTSAMTVGKTMMIGDEVYVQQRNGRCSIVDFVGDSPKAVMSPCSAMPFPTS